MPGCYVTRRDLMIWTAAATAAGLWAPPAGASGATTAMNLELVTLTDTEAVITWYTGATGSTDDVGRLEPAPADAVVRWGTSPTALTRETSSGRTDTPYHRVRLTGLEPGRTYYYQAFSNGQAAVPTVFSMIDGNAVSDQRALAEGAGPFSFTVPQPPPGRFLYSIVLCNDLHIGETTAGHVGGLNLKGISQVPGLRPYPELMFESLLDDAHELGASLLLAAGDITAEAVPVDLRTARRLFDRFGDRHVDWFAARGNHDRAHEGQEYASCSVGRWQGNDCFVDEFFEGDDTTWFSTETGGLRIIGLDTYDKAGDGGDAGLLAPEQFDWFTQSLVDDPDTPTLVFGHHPLLVDRTPYPNTPGGKLDQDQAAQIIERYAAAPGVFLHHAGHTHRNCRTDLVDSRRGAQQGVLQQEVAAVKEYPGGFTVLRVHEGGYALNFHKSTSDDARAWSERSRMEIAGTWPQFSLGGWLDDRNTVVERDLSDLKAPTAATSAASTVAGPGERSGHDDDNSPVPWLAGIGVGFGVAAAAGAGTLLALRRRRERDATNGERVESDPPTPG